LSQADAARGIRAALDNGILSALGIEDFALMVGALASFLAIAATMYLTRNINWYGNSSDVDVATPLQT